MHIVTIAPVSRTVSYLLRACLEEEWDDPDEIAGFIASQLSPQPDPGDPRRWWITLPSADGSDPDEAGGHGKPSLVHGIVAGNLILLPETVARAYAEDHQSICALKTYAEARRFEPQGMNAAPGLDEDDYDEVPADEDPYDATLTNEYLDGVWPPRAATIALDHLAEEDLDDIGEERENLGGAPYLYIDPATETDLISTLRARGFELRRDDDLIRQVDPYG